MRSNVVSTQKRTACICCGFLLAMAAAVLMCWLVQSSPVLTDEVLAGDELGLVLIDIPDEKAAASYHVEVLGVYVLAVDEDHQAYHAGIRSGDCIVSINGKPVLSTNDFFEAQALLQPCQQMQLAYTRDAVEGVMYAALTVD